jgi:PII-like signaling protein
MTLTGAALRMTVFVGEGKQVHHRPLYTEIVHRAHAAGLAGATVVRGCEGYGASSRIHTTRILSLTEDLPVVVLIVDRPDKIRAFLPEVEDLVTEGLIILDEVEVVHYVGRDPRDGTDDGDDAAPGEDRPRERR